MILLLSINARADGCFVAPKFVWDKYKDINEPTQKAIVTYDGGQENLILQVKYDGPVEEFGWLIPVPNVPTVKEGSMECFYELSKFTQKKFEYEPRTRAMAKGVFSAGQEVPESAVKVIEIQTVGAYQVAVLSAKDPGALENWLAANQFTIPADKTAVIDSYVKQGWYFVAARINVSKTGGFTLLSGTPKDADNAKATIEEKLSNGELHPLQISFATEKCVFPLKISSVNGQPSEVQIYVLSVEPLIEKGLLAQKLAENYRWRTNMLAESRRAAEGLRRLRPRYSPPDFLPRPWPEPDNELSGRSEIDADELFQYAQAGRKDLRVCSKRIPLPAGKEVWVTKITRTFAPEEMRDLEFVPAIPELAAHLGDSEGAFAAANLAQLGAEGASALLAAMKDKNPAVRAHALAPLWEMSREEIASRFDGELQRLFPGLLKDGDPEVRFHAMQAVETTEDPRYFSVALDLLRDDYGEIRLSAEGYIMPQREEGMKHVAYFHQLLKDTNAMVQATGLRLLFQWKVKLPRAEVLPLFSVPRMEAAALAYQIMKPEGISGEEAKPLLQNSDWMVRILGLKVLADNSDKDSVTLAIPLLKDNEEIVRRRARDLLADLTGKNFSVDQPDEWEKWWSENRATFTPDPQQTAERRNECMRQMREAILRRNAAGTNAPGR